MGRIDGAELKTPNGHTDPVLSVALSNDGTRIDSGSWDMSVRVWDIMYNGQHWVSSLTLDNWVVSLPGYRRLLWIPLEIKQVLR